MFDLEFLTSEGQTKKSFFVAGCDEVGRGPLAGPVVAACVAIHVKKFDQEEIKTLLRSWQKKGITDSKKLKSEAREAILKGFPFGQSSLMANQIYTHLYSKNITITLSIKEIQAEVIDQINILQASLLAMKEATLLSCPSRLGGIVLIDGNKKFKSEEKKIRLKTIVKGDSKSLLIGLASIAAKEYRDLLMKDLDKTHPGYGWEKNAGYPTAKHLEAIDALGVTEFHRLSFRGVKEVYEERGYRRS